MKASDISLPLTAPAERYNPAGKSTEVICYESSVPASELAAMDDVYQHLYCSPQYFEAAAALQGASLYVVKQGGRPQVIVPYHRSEREVTVATEYMSLASEDIERFSRHMFDRYPQLRRIVFPKIMAFSGTMSFPLHATVCSEDMVVDLPETVKEYEAAVGKNMRRNIKRYSSALKKDFPSYQYDLYLEQDISEQDLRDIVALSTKRMRSKNIVPRFTDVEVEWIIKFAKQCGIVGVARIDGKVAAGAIGFRFGDRYFMHVIAHAPKYNEYSLGILCYYYTICEGIARGARRFHLLNGRYDYKYRLLASRFDVVHLDVYRNWLSLLFSFHKVARKEYRAQTWRFKQWLLHDVPRKEGRGYRLLARFVNHLRRSKRAKGTVDAD